MQIADAQRDVQTTFIGGFVGQLVSGLIWVFSAALATWASHRAGILALVFGGMLIFPLTQLGLRLMGRSSSLPKDHPMNALAMQIAFIVPICLPVVGAATLYRHAWFYPSVMLVLGAHYLPFVFLYGMREFAILATVLITAALGFGAYAPSHFAMPAWFAGAVLVVFAFLLRRRASLDAA